MKNLTFILAFVCTSLYGQNNDSIFTFTKEGLTPYVVRQVPALSKTELYTKAIEWAMHTFSHPDKCLLAKTENEYLRIEGYTSVLYSYKVFGVIHPVDAKYQIELYFKDGRYKFVAFELRSNFEGSWLLQVPYSPERAKAFFDKSGNVIKSVQPLVSGLTDTFNRLNESLYSYYSKGTKTDTW